MAQDPHREHQSGEGPVNTSHLLDTVTLYRSTAGAAEIEADLIRGLLDSNGIPSILQRAAGYPSLGFEVRVPRAHLREAEQTVEEAKAAGPAAAADAWEAGR